MKVIIINHPEPSVLTTGKKKKHTHTHTHTHTTLSSMAGHLVWLDLD